MASGTGAERIEGEREGPEWSQLPKELLETIAKKMALLSDYIRFRSVCKSWRSAARPAKLRRQPPFLLLPPDRFADTSFLFSVSTGRIHTISLPEASNKKILASSCGWLLMLDITTMSPSLLNPVAGAQIQLPRLTGFLGLPFSGWSHQSCRFEGFLSLDPNSSRHEWFVMVRSLDFPKNVYYCRTGDGDWSVLRAKASCIPCSVAYCGGRFFVLDWIGRLAIHAAQPAPPCAVIPLLPLPSRELARCYLVKASEAELLLFAHTSSSFVDPDTGAVKDFKLFKLDLSGGPFVWSEIDGIGDRALFSFPGNPSVVCARDFPGCKHGCVYFEADLNAYLEWYGELRHIEVLSLENGICECIWRRQNDATEDETDPIWVSFSLC